MKLGQAALIGFIVLVVVIVAFLLLLCCMYCPGFIGGNRQHEPSPTPYHHYPDHVQGILAGWIDCVTYLKKFSHFRPESNGETTDNNVTKLQQHGTRRRTGLGTSSHRFHIFRVHKGKNTHGKSEDQKKPFSFRHHVSAPS